MLAAAGLNFVQIMADALPRILFAILVLVVHVAGAANAIGRTLAGLTGLAMVASALL